MHTAPPLSLRKLKAEMVMKNIRLGVLSSRIGESAGRVSGILSGKRIEPHVLAKIRNAIRCAPMPREVVA